MQGAFVSDEEREQVINFIKQGTTLEYDDEILRQIEKAAAGKDAPEEKDEDGHSAALDDNPFSGCDELLPQADIVIGCLPNTPGTAGLLTETRLRRMKQDALLVNVGRGTLLSTAELAAVLADGYLSGAVLDVCDTEPLPPSSPLWGMENVLLTPHVSGRGFGHDRGTERLIWEIVMDNLARYLEGKNLRHIVDINRGY